MARLEGRPLLSYGYTPLAQVQCGSKTGQLLGGHSDFNAAGPRDFFILCDCTDCQAQEKVTASRAPDTDGFIGSLLTLGMFERHGGRGASKKSMSSIKVVNADGSRTELGVWLNAKSRELGTTIVGRRVEVLWPFEGEGGTWFAGRVAAFNSSTCCHLINYDDGTSEWLKLHAERYRWLTAQQPTPAATLAAAPPGTEVVVPSPQEGASPITPTLPPSNAVEAGAATAPEAAITGAGSSRNANVSGNSGNGGNGSSWGRRRKRGSQLLSSQQLGAATPSLGQLQAAEPSGGMGIELMAAVPGGAVATAAHSGAAEAEQQGQQQQGQGLHIPTSLQQYQEAVAARRAAEAAVRAEVISLADEVAELEARVRLAQLRKLNKALREELQRAQEDLQHEEEEGYQVTQHVAQLSARRAALEEEHAELLQRAEGVRRLAQGGLLGQLQQLAGLVGTAEEEARGEGGVKQHDGKGGGRGGK